MGRIAIVTGLAIVRCFLFPNGKILCKIPLLVTCLEDFHYAYGGYRKNI